MTEHGPVDERSDARTPTGKMLKRRGILAVAGAVVTGLVAKQVAEPIAAATFLTLSNNDDATNVGTAPTTITTRPTFPANVPLFMVDARGGLSLAAAVSALGSPNGIGIVATGGIGNLATTAGTGIVGQGGSAEFFQGTSGPGGIGVLAQGGSGTVGGDGVIAYGSDGGNRFGNGQGGNGVTGVAGTGPMDGMGVIGQSRNGIGVYGTTTGLYGVRGDAGSALGSAGVLGYTNNVNGVAFGTIAAVPATVAGYFNGITVVNGDFGVTGHKSAVVKDAAGNHRLMYCVEAPESWFEDVGKATLLNGTASVTLDADFAALIHTDDYHIFLTSFDVTCKGLSVAAHSAHGFTVQELNGGASSGVFSWRVMAKRADIKGERLAKFTLPTLTMPASVTLRVPPPMKTPGLPLPMPAQGRTTDAVPTAPTPASAPLASTPTVGSPVPSPPAPAPPRRP